jgi:heme/copper-type cytochrome/quinol oxidase subunit 1
VWLGGAVDDRAIDRRGAEGPCPTVIGGAMALLIRGELAEPGLQFLSNEQYNQLVTMHGTIMLLLYATPILFGFANYIVPLQIGAPDVALPRLTRSRTGCSCSAGSS